jgi:hypothetical protein
MCHCILPTSSAHPCSAALGWVGSHGTPRSPYTDCRAGSRGRHAGRSRGTGSESKTHWAAIVGTGITRHTTWNCIGRKPGRAARPDRGPAGIRHRRANRGGAGECKGVKPTLSSFAVPLHSWWPGRRSAGPGRRGCEARGTLVESRLSGRSGLCKPLPGSQDTIRERTLSGTVWWTAGISLS